LSIIIKLISPSTLNIVSWKVFQFACSIFRIAGIPKAKQFIISIKRKNPSIASIDRCRRSFL